MPSDGYGRIPSVLGGGGGGGGGGLQCYPLPLGAKQSRKIELLNEAILRVY